MVVSGALGAWSRIDKAEWLKDIMDGSSAFLALAGESISERECKGLRKDLILKSN